MRPAGARHPPPSPPHAVTPPDLLARLRAFDVPLFSLGGSQFSLFSLLQLVLAFALLFWGAAALRRVIVGHLLARTSFDLGTRQAVGGFARYVVLVIGLVLILQNAGINLTALSVVGGAIGVGVGFGLQNIISNFISGLIVMLERPIKVGDRIEVGGVEGTVREIGARRTTIVTLDHVAILVPNQRFIVDNVVNLVYTDAPLRLRVPVSVAQGPDPAEVRRLLLDAARAHAQVLAEPAPAVLLPSLGGASMGFELVVWHDARGISRQQLTSDLNYLVAERLRAGGLRQA